jgi:hypothetical protein
VRIVIFRLSASGWDGSPECRTRSSWVHRADTQNGASPAERGGASLEILVMWTADAGGPATG